MENRPHSAIDRRTALTLMGAAGLATTTGLNMARPARAERPLETTRLRLALERPACWAPQYLAEALMRQEGFTDIEFVPTQGAQIDGSLRAGKLDIALGFSGRQIKGIEPGGPGVFLSGFHAGCYSLIAQKEYRSLHDLKGKTIRAGRAEGDGPNVFFHATAAYLGLDPKKDFKYAFGPAATLDKFKSGEISALFSFAPEPQKLTEQGIGRVLLDTNVDRPWSQYFCCMVMGHRAFIKQNPEATRRALRALLKANDLCVQNPEAAAEGVIGKKVRKESERKYIIQAMSEIPYDKWRDYNPEDTVRFYGLRLHELGISKASPNDLVAQNTDWSFLESLRGELGITF